MALLEVENLSVTFSIYRGLVKAVNGISFKLNEGEILGLVGESGCGKTVSSLALTRLLNEPPAAIEGAVFYRGTDILARKRSEMNRIRGREISMIFQNPGTSLNPVFTIGEQITRIISLHRGLNAKKARKEALEIFDLVGLPYPEQILASYPHQLSGGMKQRIIIGMALSCRASLLIADEPTTALDVTIQAQILKLMLEMRKMFQVAIILITHDVGVAAQTCDRIIVMYGGYLVEVGPAEQILADPRHPYTAGLMGCLPYRANNVFDLATIRGSVPDLSKLLTGCPFHPRCAYRQDRCSREKPPLYNLGGDRQSMCFLLEGGSGNDLQFTGSA